MTLNNVSALILALGTMLAGLASVGALWLGYKNRKQLRPSNGTTVAQIAENTNAVARATRRDIYRLAVALGEHLQHSDAVRKQLGLPPEPKITDPFPEPHEYPPGYDNFYARERRQDNRWGKGYDDGD